MKRTSTSGSSHEGGILLTVLGLLVVFSFVFVAHVEIYRLSNEIKVNMAEHYQVRALQMAALPTILTLHQQPSASAEIKGTEYYNLGKVFYTYRHDSVLLKVTLQNGKVFTLKEKWGAEGPPLRKQGFGEEDNQAR